MDRHIAFVSLPAHGHGHVNPTLPVVAELVRRGWRVSYATAERFGPEVEKTGATLAPTAGRLSGGPRPGRLSPEQRALLGARPRRDAATRDPRRRPGHESAAHLVRARRPDASRHARPGLLERRLRAAGVPARPTRSTTGTGSSARHPRRVRTTGGAPRRTSRCCSSPSARPSTTARSSSAPASRRSAAARSRWRWGSGCGSTTWARSRPTSTSTRGSRSPRCCATQRRSCRTPGWARPDAGGRPQGRGSRRRSRRDRVAPGRVTGSAGRRLRHGGPVGPHALQGALRDGRTDELQLRRPRLRQHRGAISVISCRALATSPRTSDWMLSVSVWSSSPVELVEGSGRVLAGGTVAAWSPLRRAAGLGGRPAERGCPGRERSGRWSRLVLPSSVPACPGRPRTNVGYPRHGSGRSRGM